MEAVALLRQAAAAGLLLVPQGDQLVVRGPKTAGPVVMLLRDHKPEVMRALFFRERYPKPWPSSSEWAGNAHQISPSPSSSA
jgi:hypothetical protein